MAFGTVQFIEIILIILLLALSAFFSGSETAYTGLSRARLKAMDPDGKDRKVQRALANHEDFDRLLTTILVGNNIVNTASSTICTALLIYAIGDDLGTVAATVLMITVLLVAGEITPKTIAKHNAESFAVKVSGAVHMCMVVLSPLTYVFLKATKGIANRVTHGEEEEAPTDEETTAMIDEILDEGTMEAEESKLIRSAMDFDEKTVGDICVPRVDIVAVSKDADSETVRRAFINSEFSRLPVYEGSIDRIIGYVSMKDFFLGCSRDDGTPLSQQLHSVKFFPEQAGLDEVFSAMQKDKAQVVVVLDEFGGTSGMVTLEDLLEEIVGEIYDESDRETELITPNDDGTFKVSGDANIFDVMERLGLQFECEDFGSVSIGGYIASVLERIPRIGDEVRAGDAVISVSNYRNRRVREVCIRIEPLAPAEEDSETDPSETPSDS